jgi:hypothetical protein
MKGAGHVAVLTNALAERPGALAAVESTEPANQPVSAWAVLAALMVLAAGAWFRERLGRSAIPTSSQMSWFERWRLMCLRDSR